MLAIGQPDIVICVLLASLILFATDALRYDLIALGVAITLALTGCLEPSEAFRGFSSEAVVLIASMYVFGHALSRTGLSELLGSRILARGVPGEAFLVLRIVLRERNLVSRDLCPGDGETPPLPGRVLACGESETVSVMVNEEDHLRLQAFSSGFDLDLA